MTTKWSQFGSLEQRTQRREELDGDRVRHVWLDSVTPALVVDRRHTATGWEGRLVYVADGQVTSRWCRRPE